MIHYEMQTEGWLKQRKSELIYELDIIENILRQLREAREKDNKK